MSAGAASLSFWPENDLCKIKGLTLNPCTMGKSDPTKRRGRNEDRTLRVRNGLEPVGDGLPLFAGAGSGCASAAGVIIRSRTGRQDLLRAGNRATGGAYRPAPRRPVHPDP